MNEKIKHRPFDPLIFWGPAEPAYHYMTPPPFFGGDPKTPEAAANAMTYSFFHWGLSAWAIYAMLTIPLAHACYTKGLPFKFSSAFYYVIGDKVYGSLGKILDIFAVFATLGNFLWYGVVGGAGIEYDVTATLQKHGVESAIFSIAQHLPLSGLLAVCLIFLITTFFLTSANSAAVSLSMFVSGHETPGRNLRAFWGIALGAVAVEAPIYHKTSRPKRP